MVADPPTVPRTEGRREIRHAWQRAFDGELSLRLPATGAVHPATLQNVSAGGAGLLLGLALPVGSDVTVLLKTAGMAMEFEASVAWCQPLAALAPAGPGAAPSQKHSVGLELRASGAFVAMLQANPLSRG